jgi:hypothetical protein
VIYTPSNPEIGKKPYVPKGSLCSTHEQMHSSCLLLDLSASF